MASKTVTVMTVAFVSIFTMIFSAIVANSFYLEHAPIIYTALATSMSGVGMVGGGYSLARACSLD